MKSRSLGIIFVAAVIVPSILLGALSIRSAGREEAFIERDRAATMDGEVTHAVDLANAEVQRAVDELRASISIAAGGDYIKLLKAWKTAHPLVSVPFLLSPQYGILWPSSPTGTEEKRFLKENGDFLSDKTATAVLQNIAVRYQAEILAQAGADAAKADKAKDTPAEKKLEAIASVPEQSASNAAAPPTAAPTTASKSAAALAGPAASAQAPAAGAADTSAPGATAPTTASKAAAAAPTASRSVVAFAPSPDDLKGALSNAGAAEADREATVDPSVSRQVALDAFAQSQAVQKMVYDEAQAKGDTVSPRVVEPAVAAQPAAAANTAQKQPSQYVVTSQLLSQIASQGDAGIIPRFIGEKLVFLFWSRQADGRIAGCEISTAALRARVAGIVTSTWTPLRILTLLDENGAPLATPPDVTGINWHKPFVAHEIGESLPRWEAAAYLTDPNVIHAQARSSSLVIWILVVILFVSVSGGGVMVLNSVYGEMRLAQKKATFVANVSHELKTPLTSIRLFIDLLRKTPPAPPAKRTHYLGMMASETERLTRLIDNVLDFSARERGKTRYTKTRVDPARVVSEIVESQRVRLESRGFTLGLDVPHNATAVVADPEALKQVLLNLLSNAEKYSLDRKEIGVEVVRESATVAIHVRDRGIGIDAKDRERIFREFVRLDESLTARVQGTGLGLTIARRIARDHGGDVSHAPRDGGGSDFTVTLPLADAQGEKA